MRDSKTSKKAWFNTHGIQDTKFLQETNLPDGQETFYRDVVQDAKKARWQIATPAVSDDVNKFFDQIFRDWILPGPGRSALSRHFAVDTLTKKVAIEKPVADDKDVSLLSLFDMWLVRDHGVIAAFDHGVRMGKEKNEYRGFTATVSKAAYSFKSIENALIPIGVKSRPFVVVPIKDPKNPRSQIYCAIAKFKHAPHDTLLIVAEQEQDQLRIVDLQWSVDD